MLASVAILMSVEKGGFMNHDLALKHAAPAPSGAVNFSGVWHNQLGSTMDLTISGSDVTGTYTSSVSSGGVAVSGPISGFINGDLIGFSVLWPSAAITAWVGQLVVESNVDTIKTLWQMTTNVPDAQEPTGLWASIYAGADTFVR